MREAKSDSVIQVEDFLAEIGIGQANIQDAVAVGLRRALVAEGAVPHVRRDGRLRLRALLPWRWAWADTESIQHLILRTVRDVNPNARIRGGQIHRHNNYVEAEIDVT